jgi:hypothetical protein
MSIAPFSGDRGALQARSDALVDTMLVNAHSSSAAQKCRDTMRKLPVEVLELVADTGAKIHLLQGRRYDQASRELKRLGLDVNSWPVPPAGLFVVSENTMYLQDVIPMAIHHEFGHAIDCALGGGIYKSGIDTTFRDLFANAKAFVNPYAATGLDEFFAESHRAFHGVGNESYQPWPAATPKRLRAVQPELYKYFDSLMLEVRDWAIQTKRAVSPRRPREIADSEVTIASVRGKQLGLGF